MTAQKKNDLKSRTQIIKALAHPTRLFMVEQLSKKEECVWDLTEMVGVDISTISKHLAVLKKAGIVESEKKGLQVCYHLSMPCVGNFLSCVGQMHRTRPSKKGRK